VRAAALLLLALATAAAAQAPAADVEEEALKLADQPEAKPQQAGDWRFFVEGALRDVQQRNPEAGVQEGRLSVDLRFDKVFAPGWRAVLADRLDVTRSDTSERDRDVNTLKEAYLSWQASPERIADLGRVNVRNGVALGYNPTDYFRAGALRSVVSLDPVSLRENRMGTGMLRGQALWESGSLSALYSPKLADAPSTGDFNADLGSTNSRDRWLLTLSQKLVGTFSPQWLLQGGADQSVQLGLNVTAVPNDATVAYFEWSGGRSPSLAAQAGIVPDDSTFRSRVATGVTYTTPGNLSLTLEYDYNGAGLDAAGWDALRSGPPASYAQYRGFAAGQQDPPTRQNLFFYALWQDLLVKHFDLALMLRGDLLDDSRLQWLEARYHWPRVDAALQVQHNSGEPGSNYGAVPERRVLQALVRWYF
jgi:hypothetical protein